MNSTVYLCKHNNPVRLGEPFTLDQCRLCWLALNSGASTGDLQRAETTTICRHLGAVPTDRGGCGSCQAKWVYPCEVFGRCSPAGYHAGVKRCDGCEHRTPVNAEKPEPAVRRVLLTNHGEPGDVLALSSAIESLHRAHPARFVTALAGAGAEFLAYNPNVVAVEEVIDGHPVAWARVVMPGTQSDHRADDRGLMEVWCTVLAGALGVPVPLWGERPCLTLAPDECARPAQVRAFSGDRRYWLVGAEPRSDLVGWSASDYQRFVDLLSEMGPVVQIGDGSSAPGAPPLRGALDLRTGLGARELARVVAHAAGGVGGGSLLRLLCAAFERPHVCAAGLTGDRFVVHSAGPSRGHPVGAPAGGAASRSTVSPEQVIGELLAKCG